MKGVNPLYPVSALLLLGGYWLLGAPMRDAGRLGDLILLLLVLNAYEAVVLGLAWFLRGRTEARTLPFIELILLGDGPFLMESIWAVDFAAGAICAVALLALAAAKIAVLHRLLGVRPTSAHLASRLPFVALLLALPGWIQWAALHSMGTLCTWQAATLLAGLSFLLFAPPRKPALGIALLAMAGAHVASSAFVASVPLSVDAISMPVLAIGVWGALLGRARGNRPEGILLTATVGAVLLCIGGQGLWTIELPGIGDVRYTTAAAVLAASAGAHFAMAAAWRRVWLVPGGIAALLLAVVNCTVGRYRSLAPDSREQWGALLILAAFAALGAGAALSLHRRSCRSRFPPSILPEE